MKTQAEDNRGAFSAIRRIYSRWGKHPSVYASASQATFLGRERAIRRRAVETLQLRRGDRVLDIGCGTGRNFPELENAIGSSGHLVGFDATREMLEAARAIARKFGWENIELIEGDAARLDVGERLFDGVLSTLAMSVVPDYRRAIARVRDVLRPGGRVSICDAAEFEGPWRVLNGAVRAAFVPLTGWNSDHDLVGTMREVFGDVTVESFNGGSLFVATATRVT